MAKDKHLKQENTKVVNDTSAPGVESAGDILLARLCEGGSRADWRKQGAYIPLWLDEHLDSTTLAQVVVQLEVFVEAHEWAVPKLLLADAYLRLPTPPMPHVLALLRASLVAAHWHKEPEWLALWCHHLGAGLGLLLQAVHRAGGDESEVTLWKQRTMQLPWEQAAESLTPQWMHRLCRALSDCGAWDATARLAARCGRMHPDWPDTPLWEAYVAIHEASQTATSVTGPHEPETVGRQEILSQVEAGLTANTPPILDDAMWCELAHYCSSCNAMSLAESCLLQVQVRDSDLFLRAGLAFCLAIDALPEALRLLNEHKLLPHEPDQELLEVECGVLLALGEFAKAELLLDESLASEGFAGSRMPAEGRFLMLLQATLWLHTAREAPGLAAFRRAWAMPPQPGAHLWFTAKRLAGMLSLFGDGYRRLEDDQEALSCYMQALRISPTPQLFLSTSHLLFKHHQFADVAALLAQGLVLFPDETPLRYGMFLACARVEDWAAAREQFRSIERGWFRAHALEKAWLLGEVQLSMAEGDVLAAFVACEQMLDEILQDEGLRALRQEIVEQLQTTYQEMAREQHAIATATQGRALIEAQLQAVLAHHHAQQSAFAHMTSAHEQLQRELHLHEGALPNHSLPDELLEATHPGLGGLVAEASRQALGSALFLHQTLLESEDPSRHDFGPVVLQLARAVEGEVNQTLIDPLVAGALEAGGCVGDFPPISIGSLASSGNSLSLGDAARLLYHKIARLEADGSTTIERNPHSSARHVHWLAVWWDSAGFQALPGAEQEALQHVLPRQLQMLAGLRNQAGHAGAALTMEQASQAMALVFGGPKTVGVLTLVTKLPSQLPKGV